MDWGHWAKRTGELVNISLSTLVFVWLDLLEIFLCVFYRYVDVLWEGKKIGGAPCYCYCSRRRRKDAEASKDRENIESETLYSTSRKNLWREMLGFHCDDHVHDETDAFKQEDVGTRWSDCNCESCVSWLSNDHRGLRVVLNQPSTDGSGRNDDGEGREEMENVIFIHGFLSSSSFWTEKVFPYIRSICGSEKYRLFAVDLLGFGGSPKPRDCLYTLRDHLQMIQKSLLESFHLTCFHLVAHSMGCVIALALAAHSTSSVKSLTLIAPPYFTSSRVSERESLSMAALKSLADRKIWPPLLFGSAVMSWYEHLGRCVCFLVCRSHRTWEFFLKLLPTTTTRDVQMFTDFTSHTHHSAWHTMHNVICGGANLMDDYMETLKDGKVTIHIIQGSQDKVIPLECSINIKTKVPDAEVHIIPNAGHTTVILNREEDFTRDLLQIWASAADIRAKTTRT